MALLASAVLVGCGSEAPGSSASDSISRDDDPGPLTSAELDAVASCAQLHEAVLAKIGDEAAAAGATDDRNPIEDWRPEDLPDLAMRIHPPRPYGGLGGDAVGEQYEQLGCHPDDEFPAILAWFGLPPDTPRHLGEGGPLGEVVSERAETDGAGAFAAIGLARRLGEGAETTDSRLFAALRQVAAAQDAHRADRGRYADNLEDLVAYGVDDNLIHNTDVIILVTAADDRAYCVHGADHGSAVLESHDGVPRNRAPGSPSCPKTFPNIDS